MVVVNRTLRGGQEIRTASSVLVCGNVNPGAQIIAGGSIDIRGTCRGLVHAGASGDTDSFIIADHLMPTQIRIANLIARSPDHMEMTERAERASIKDGQIVIEPIER
jgi:septum site-determining protein MinC